MRGIEILVQFVYLPWITLRQLSCQNGSRKQKTAFGKSVLNGIVQKAGFSDGL